MALSTAARSSRTESAFVTVMTDSKQGWDMLSLSMDDL
jgi:hypothetical protein